MLASIVLAATFVNPVLPADYSDLDCIRSGDRFYAITSTLHCSPGMDVLESSDMVNWQVVGHVVADTAVFGEDWTWKRMRRYGRGVWAGCIREREGRFYCYFGTPDEGIFVATATDPAGPWSPPHKMAFFGRGWDDTGVLFDGDKGYLAVTQFSAGYKTYVFDLTPDGLEVVLESQTLVNEGHGREANKLYKWNDTYYHLYSEVEGGGRRLMMARAKNPKGPYSERRVLSHPQREADEPNQGGFLVDDAGNWFFFTHHGHGQWYGRAASLLPVTWIDGWPIVGEPDAKGIGRMVWNLERPVIKNPVAPRLLPAGFLSPEWAWNHAPRREKVRLTESRLELDAFKPLRNGDFLTVGNVFSKRSWRNETNAFSVVLDVSQMAEGQRAGICHFGGTTSEFGVKMENGKKLLYRKDSGAEETDLGEIAESEIRLTTSWGRDGIATYSPVPNSPYKLTWGKYRGDRVGVFTYNMRGESGTAVFSLCEGGVFADFAPTWESLEKKTTPEWYNNAKFGIFCHWGIQCAAEDGDWYARTLYDPNHWQGKHFRERYGDPKEGGVTELIRRWKGENWNPDELCALYRKMGATFILAMANHHDNFDNWNSTYQPWNAVNMGPKRDVLGAWSAAARKNGLRFGTSFHAAHAWTWLEVSRDYDGLLTKEDGQGKWWEGYDPQQLYWQNHEPSPNYKNLGLIHRRWNWGDGASRPTDEFMENFRLRTMDAIAKYKPDLIYFDDTVVPFWGVANLQGAHPGLRIVADFYNQNPDAVAAGKCLDESQRKAMTWDVERGTPPTPMFPKWQTDTCIGNWHYERSVYERGRYKSAADVVRLLVDVVSKNGNLCLSIPIRSDGTIDEKERKICEDIADWMSVNRAAIFDTVPYEICGEGPQIANAPELRAQGFNEGRIPRPGKDDVRYLKAKDGTCVYAVELAPDGKAPNCPALEAKGLKLVRSFESKPGFPVVHVFE